MNLGLLKRILADKPAPHPMRLPGILGKSNTAGSVAVKGKEGFVYVRVGYKGELDIAFNNRVDPCSGLLVIVGYDEMQPELFQVLSARQIYRPARPTPTPPQKTATEQPSGCQYCGRRNGQGRFSCVSCGALIE